MIEVRGVSVRRGKRVTLDSVNASVQRGQVVGIVGPNGAGKSTLLHAMAGSLGVAGGEVLVDGQPLNDLSLAEQARTRAVMSQHVDMAFPYPVHEVIAMGWEPFRGLQPLDTNRLERIASDCGVYGLLWRRFDQLSGGERQRVQFARTCLQVDGILTFSDGGVWLLDEPTASLDIGHELLVLRHLREAATRNVGVCLVVHDLEKAARFCDHTILLDRGRVAASGAPREVLSDHTLSEVYDTPITTEWHSGLERLLVHA
ncbi:MAG: ATP-binding cassette domain-containing protein [Pseudomonadota bacterium]